MKDTIRQQKKPEQLKLFYIIISITWLVGQKLASEDKRLYKTARYYFTAIAKHSSPL